MNALDTAFGPTLGHARSLARKKPQAPTPAQTAARVARYKINFLNRLIRQNDIASLIQFGCGDGRLAQRLKIAGYTGVDAALGARASARQTTPGAARHFVTPQELAADADAELALSLDVIHSLTDGEFNAYLRDLFDAARRFVVIHGSDGGRPWAPTPARPFATHVAHYFPAWRLAAHVPNPFPLAADAADFFVYARAGAACAIPVLALI